MRSLVLGNSFNSRLLLDPWSLEADIRNVCGGHGVWRTITTEKQITPPVDQLDSQSPESSRPMGAPGVLGPKLDNQVTHFSHAASGDKRWSLVAKPDPATTKQTFVSVGDIRVSHVFIPLYAMILEDDGIPRATASELYF
jgi:hypothetical protein